MLDNNEIGDESYRVTLDLNGGVKFVYKLRSPNDGDSLAELETEQSGYRRMLADIAPEKYWLYFVGRPNSSEVLRYTMQLGADAGLAVGWDLMPDEEPIAMASWSSRGKY